MRLKARKVKDQTIIGNERTDFPMLGRPAYTDTLRFPDDITDLSAQNVSDLHGKYTKLYAYANQNLALTNVGLLRIETQESLLRNKLFRSRPNIMHQDKWRRDALVAEDPQMEQLMKRRQSLLEKREILQMFIGNYERYLFALSRELSRKGNDREYSPRVGQRF